MRQFILGPESMRQFIVGPRSTRQFINKTNTIELTFYSKQILTGLLLLCYCIYRNIISFGGKNWVNANFKKK